MHAVTHAAPDRLAVRVGWWVLAVIAAVYGAYALSSGIAELSFLLGWGPEEKHRAAPVMFVIHALSGAVALLSGPLQFNARLRRRRWVHRTAGMAYVIGVWVASTFAVIDARSFAVSAAAKAIFVAIATAWFTVTTVAYLRVRAHRYASHREWMIRSFALSLFFVTFSIWVPALAASPLPNAIAYPLALLLSGGLNVAAAEWWVRRTRGAVGSAPQEPPSSIPITAQADIPAASNV